MGVGPLCKLFGKSRQAYYNRKWELTEREQTEIVVVELIRQIRRELPGLGGHKMYKCMFQPLRTNNLKIGRDKSLPSCVNIICSLRESEGALRPLNHTIGSDVIQILSKSMLQVNQNNFGWQILPTSASDMILITYR